MSKLLDADNMQMEIDKRERIEYDIIINIAKAKRLIENFNKN